MVAGETTRQVLRAMAWQRAKGELESMLETFSGDCEDREELETHINAFTTYIENNRLQE